MSQDSCYLDSEADAFYERNLRDLDPTTLRPAKRQIAEWIESAGVRPKRVLEYGCSHGDLLRHYAAAGADSAHGVEPSESAVERGRAAHGDAVKLWRGTLADNPVNADPGSRGRFDLVVVEDVLCWVSRETLFQSIANIDGALAPDGYLFLREFLPRENTRNRNHHVVGKEVYCYKPAGPHARIFTASGAYRRVAERVWLDESDDWVTEAGRNRFESRWCDSLLQKSSLSWSRER